MYGRVMKALPPPTAGVSASRPAIALSLDAFAAGMGAGRRSGPGMSVPRCARFTSTVDVVGALAEAACAVAIKSAALRAAKRRRRTIVAPPEYR